MLLVGPDDVLSGSADAGRSLHARPHDPVAQDRAELVGAARAEAIEVLAAGRVAAVRTRAGATHILAGAALLADGAVAEVLTDLERMILAALAGHRDPRAVEVGLANDPAGGGLRVVSSRAHLDDLGLARGRATVAAVDVAVVAVLAGRRVEHGVAAHDAGAVAVAAGGLSARVALLARGDVELAVAARRGRAVGVALLRGAPGVTLLDRGLHDAVAALGGHAGVEATIVVDVVAVVAHLTHLYDGVAAGAGLAAVATPVIVDGVAVVARLGAHLHDAVAARGEGAVAAAGVVVELVAVVARLGERP